MAIHSRRVGGPSAVPAEWAAVLESTQASLSGIASLSVTDAGRTIRHSTLSVLVGQSRLDSYVFRRLAADPVEALVASTSLPTVQDRRQMIIPMGRLLTKADGRFDGIIAASFVPEGLRSFFKAVDAAQSGMVSVFHPSGIVLFQEPSETNPIGNPVIDNPVFEAAQARAGAGTIRERTGPNGAALLSAFRPLQDPPLTVAVSLSEAEMLTDWQREATISAGVLAVISLGATLALLVAFRQLDARVAAEQASATRRRSTVLNAPFLTPRSTASSRSTRAEWSEHATPRILQRQRELEAANQELDGFTYSVDAMKPRRVDMTTLARTVLEEIMAAETDRAIDARIADLPDALGDLTLLRQVWVNLLGNAVKYTRPRSPAVIRVTGCTGG